MVLAGPARSSVHGTVDWVGCSYLLHIAETRTLGARLCAKLPLWDLEPSPAGESRNLTVNFQEGFWSKHVLSFFLLFSFWDKHFHILMILVQFLSRSLGVLGICLLSLCIWGKANVIGCFFNQSLGPQIHFFQVACILSKLLLTDHWSPLALGSLFS